MKFSEINPDLGTDKFLGTELEYLDIVQFTIHEPSRREPRQSLFWCARGNSAQYRAIWQPSPCNGEGTSARMVIDRFNARLSIITKVLENRSHLPSSPSIRFRSDEAETTTQRVSRQFFQTEDVEYSPIGSSLGEKRTSLTVPL